MALNIEQLKSIARTEHLKTIQSLKLEGLELSSCFKLLLHEIGISIFLLSLRNNALTTIDITLGFTNLRKLDLSTNLLSNIGSKELWETMPRLQVLYLHDNLLENWDTFTSLSFLPQIVHLTLFNNPCIHLPQYRKYMLSSLPGLLALDFHIATQEERLGIYIPNPDKSKIWIQDSNDMKSFYTHMYKLRRKWEKCSPSIKIQSLWRRYYVRKHIGGHMSERDRHAITIQKHVRGWLLRLHLRKDLEKMLKESKDDYLLYTPEQYILYKAVQKIENAYRRYRILRSFRMKRYIAATKIASMWRRRKTSRYGLPILKNKTFYVLKSQQRTLICMLRAIAMYNPNVYHPANSIFDRMAPEFFEKVQKKPNGYSFTELFNRISECKTIKVVRFPDIENLPYSSIPLLQMLKWVRSAKILNSGNEKTIKNLSISKKFCTPEEFVKLNKFHTRGSTITQEERKKFKSISLNLDEYLDLIEFQAPNLVFLQELFLMILDYNRLVFSKDLPIFLPIFKISLDRVKAACTVQACFRGYRVRKNNLLAKLAIERRAVYCIQRWWRTIRYTHRMKYLVKLKKILKEFSIPIVYMQEHLFQYLIESTSSFKFLEQNFGFYCTGDTVYITHVNRKRFIPEWIGCNFQVEITGNFTVSEEEKTLQAVVLSGAKLEIVNLQDEVLDKPPIADAQIRFIKLEYKNVEEVRRRVSVLFLKTLDYRTGSYVPFFTRKTLAHPFLMSKLRSIWKLRNINPTDTCPAINILIKALNPAAEKIKIPTQPHIPKSSISPIPIVSLSPIIKNEIPTDLITERNDIARSQQITDDDILRQRVKHAREENIRRYAELKLAKQMELETKVSVFREDKEHTNEILSFRRNFEERELELKRSFIEAQNRRKQIFLNEKMFIKQFAQAKNMIGKLMKNSEIQRHKAKSAQEVKEKVIEVKQKNKEHRELVQAILFEKFKTKKIL
ncbi:hypothetical protein SteCoe_27406 [Stentor coeruleus]|uniref:Leucine-rich repeat and IQ domain-containing protein 3 n=1 Tax=Stentor coeruleus TaxID=5963 RepID=A0A1R2BAN9_9CILI|nr:hypothetical protein SteCoe_27406 [Stentor coeruleus]